uniref:Uncharacterized protein n=1 Tax=Oryza sativa subsp. japonica TaxID=39947 RepID=Q6Z9A7_ORYSJ|nr:hypothetical protein [Oryza sativa Japonica Group]
MIGLIPDQNLVVAQDRVQWDTHDFIMHDAHEKRTQYMWQHVWEWIALASWAPRDRHGLQEETSRRSRVLHMALGIPVPCSRRYYCLVLSVTGLFGKWNFSADQPVARAHFTAPNCENACDSREVWLFGSVYVCVREGRKAIAIDHFSIARYVCGERNQCPIEPMFVMHTLAVFSWIQSLDFD